MRLVLIVCCLIAALVKPVRAADGDRMAYGAGMVTCAEWQRYRSTGNKPASIQLEAWIDGFLSGYNMESEIDFIAPKPESIAYYAWIDNYCSQNPLNKVTQATILLKNELVARSRR